MFTRLTSRTSICAISLHLESGQHGKKAQDTYGCFPLLVTKTKLATIAPCLSMVIELNIVRVSAQFRSALNSSGRSSRASQSEVEPQEL